MKILNLGLETIAFQKGQFYKDLTDIIVRARAGAKDKASKEQVAKDIALCTAKYTNIQVTVEFINNFNNACIYPSIFTKESVFYGQGMAEAVKTYYDELAKIGKGRKLEGLVNPANSTVGGEFAKISHKSYYDTDFIFSSRQFSAEGAAAVILHETGHAYTFFEYLADTVMINLTLNDAYQDLMKASDDTGVRMIVERTRKMLDIDQPGGWVQDLGKDKDANSIIHILATEASVCRSKTDNKSFYTQDVAEEMAEIFCIRHGGSKGLIEVRQYFRDRQELSEMNFGILASAVLAAIGAVTIPLTGGATSVLLFVGLAGMFAGSAAAASMPDFTKFSQTIGKVRSQLVQRLKDANLPKEVIEDTLRGIDAAEAAIKDTPDDKLPFAVAFFDFFRTSKRDARAWREYTDKLEEMATNALFVRAARFGLK